MKNNISKNMAFLTAVGFMVGSGIFFKSDDILSATQGNVFIAVMGWIFISSTLLFAGISIAAIASESDCDGGFVGYIEFHFKRMFGEKIGKNLAFVAGWYQMVLYIPIMVAVVLIVFADYFNQLFGLNMSLKEQYILAFIVLVLMILWNGFSTLIASLISSTATIIKVIPLILIAILGLLFGQPENFTSTAQISQQVPTSTMALFFAPLLSMAFAFDGWISVGSLSRDMKSPKKDLPFVFVWSVIATALIYILYFIGVSMTLPAQEIISAQNEHVGQVANILLGPVGEKFVLTGVLVSVLGTSNGVFMAGARYTQKLATTNQLLGSDFLKKDSKYKTPFNSSLLIFILSVFYLVIYYLKSTYTGDNEIIINIVIDDIPMAINSIFFILVFIIAFNLYKERKVNFLSGVVAPCIAILGQVFIVITFFNLHGIYAWFYFLISAIILALGFLNRLKKH